MSECNSQTQSQTPMDNLYSSYDELFSTIIQSRDGLELFHTMDTKFIFVAKFLMESFDIPYLLENYHSYNKVKSILLESVDSKMGWNELINCLRRASRVFVEYAITYTAYSVLIEFKHNSGDIIELNYEDLYDYLNPLKCDIMSIVKIYKNTFIIMGVEQDKLNDEMTKINYLQADISHEDDTRYGLFDIKTYVFNSIKLPKLE